MFLIRNHRAKKIEQYVPSAKNDCKTRILYSEKISFMNENKEILR